MKLYFNYVKLDKAEWYGYIALNFGKEGLLRFDKLAISEDEQKDSEKVWKTMELTFEQSSRKWQFREEYLSNVKQQLRVTFAELNACITEIVTNFTPNPKN